MTETTDGRPSEIEAPILQPFYLTFGVQYRPDPIYRYGQMVHPHWPGADSNGWVTLMATDYMAARQLASLYFEDKFSTVYDALNFDLTENRRFFPRGEIAVIRQGTINTDEGAPLPRFPVSDPRFHGHEPGDVVADRIEGKLIGVPYDGHEDVELFHLGECAERGAALFESVYNHDSEVLALELDWTNLPTCAQCHTQIPGASHAGN